MRVDSAHIGEVREGYVPIVLCVPYSEINMEWANTVIEHAHDGRLSMDVRLYVDEEPRQYTKSMDMFIPILPDGTIPKMNSAEGNE